MFLFVSRLLSEVCFDLKMFVRTRNVYWLKRAFITNFRHFFILPSGIRYDIKKWINGLKYKGWFVSCYPRNGDWSMVVGLGRRIIELDVSCNPIVVDLYTETNHFRVGKGWK